MDQVRGDTSGLVLPASQADIAALGPEWLTRAFRSFGALGNDAAVTAIASCKGFAGGNSGQKVLLEIEWQSSDPALARQLFVKLSRDFEDPFRDRRKHELEAEVRLAHLARHPRFPVAVAHPWFADFHNESGTGLIISSAIPFGEGAIEPLRAKCRDWELADAAEYYRATISALARLAAADKTGSLAPDIDRLFPLDRLAASADMAFDWPSERRARAFDALSSLLETAPQLFPEAIAEPAFVGQFLRDILTVLDLEPRLRQFLHSDERLLALAHWNTNLDNAWFWREQGQLHCGLLDWGMARRMNAGYALWGGLCAAEPDMLQSSIDELLKHYAAELSAHGGPDLGAEVVGCHFDLSLALLGTALLLGTPQMLLERMPGLDRLSGPRDRALESDRVVEGFLKVFGNFMLLWQQRDIGRRVSEVLGA